VFEFFWGADHFYAKNTPTLCKKKENATNLAFTHDYVA
jgi:hypothetical protein